MTLGNYLIRPQLLDRTSGSEEFRIADVFFELSVRLLQDVMDEGPASIKIKNAVQDCIEALIEEIEQQAATTATKVEDWFSPIIETIEEGLDFGDISGGLGDAGAVITALINLAKESLANLQADKIGEKLNALADIIENDMGLHPGRLSDFLQQCFDRIIEALTTDFLNGNSSKEEQNNFLIGNHISTLKNFTLEQVDKIPFPPINIRDMIQWLVDELHRRNFDELLEDLDKLADQATGGLDKVVDALGGEISTDRGAAGRSRFSTRDIADSGEQMSWYASWFFDQDVVAVADRFDLDNAPFDSKMSYKHDALNSEVMEHLAYFTKAINEIIEAFFHFFDSRQGNYASPILNGLFASSKAIVTLIGYGHQGSGWLDYFRLNENIFYKYGVKGGLSFAGSFEQYPGRFWTYAQSTAIPDFSEAFGNPPFADMIREFLLSLLTLINHDGEAKPDAENFDKVEGFTKGLRTVAALLSALWIRRREKYFWPSQGGGLDFFLHVLLASGIIFSTEIIGWLLARLLTGVSNGKFSTTFWDTSTWIIAVISAPFTYYSNLGLLWDGDTDGGKAGQVYSLDTNGKLQKTEATFAGHPPRKSSPYRLPFEKGNLVFCSGSNLGFFSNNFNDNNIYAYDFVLRQGTEVLAMRGGTVERFDDTAADGEDNTNFLLLRHDNTDEGAIPNPLNDRLGEGQLIYSKANYQQSKHYGVRHAFALRGIPKDFIAGSKVYRGHPIMLSGRSNDIGVAGWNPVEGVTGIKISVGNGEAAGSAKTIPLVFREVNGNGVPTSSNYYYSENVKKGLEDHGELDLDKIDLYHPEYQEGFIEDSGQNFVVLDQKASLNDDSYNQRHIFLRSQHPNGATLFEYKKIIDYDGSDRKVTIEGQWDNGYPTALDTHYQIGGCPFAQSSSFQTQFAYIKTAGSPTAYHHAKIGAYSPTTLQGEIQGEGSQGTNLLEIEAIPDELDGDSLIGRHIVIIRDEQILYYKKIIDYDFITQVVTIEGQWDVNLRFAPTTDRYELGGLDYRRAEAEDKKYAFLSPSRSALAYGPTEFHDQNKPYRFLTYRREWPQ